MRNQEVTEMYTSEIGSIRCDLLWTPHAQVGLLRLQAKAVPCARYCTYCVTTTLAMKSSSVHRWPGYTMTWLGYWYDTNSRESGDSYVDKRTRGDIWLLRKEVTITRCYDIRSLIHGSLRRRWMTLSAWLVRSSTSFLPFPTFPPFAEWWWVLVVIVLRSSFLWVYFSLSLSFSIECRREIPRGEGV